MTSDSENTIYRMQAEFCKTLTNPKRLEILHLLEKSEKSVTELAKLTNLKQANVSQHLAVMRHTRIIKERRVGNNVLYSLAHPKITQACNMIRTILTEQLIRDVKSTTSGWNE